MIFDAKFEEQEQSFDVSFKEAQPNFKAGFEEKIVIEVISEHETYDGNYSVTPTLEAQTLPTKEKVMSDDLVVEAVPVYEVSNNSGGITVYIAKEVANEGK